MICAYCQTTEVQYHFTCNDGVKVWESYTCEEHLDIALTQLSNGDIDYEVKDLDIIMVDGVEWNIHDYEEYCDINNYCTCHMKHYWHCANYDSSYERYEGDVE